MGVGGYGVASAYGQALWDMVYFSKWARGRFKNGGGYYNFLVDVTCNNAIYANDITLNRKCEHASALWQQLDWC